MEHSQLGHERDLTETVVKTNIVDEMTWRWLDDAGVGPGMRVVDMGCGPGVVTAELAQRVGDGGHVYAVDRNPQMLDHARERCADLGLTNVSFIEGTFELATPEGRPVDAVVGRRVLMYQTDPVAAVRAVTRVVRPGGLVWFHEHDATIVPGDTPLPLHDRALGWLHAMLQHEGANLRMGHELFGVLRDAGLAVDQVRAEANLLTPESGYPIGWIIQQILPRLTQPGIVTEAEVDAETLDDRLAAERAEVGITRVWELVFCAWGRVPLP